MLTLTHSRRLMGFVLAVVVGAALGGCQQSDAPDQASSPSTATVVTPAPSPTASVMDGGTITLTDDGCTWEGNPGSISAGPLSVAVRNETDDYGVFMLHQLHPDRTYAEGEAAISAIQEALETGDEWPEAVSDAIAEAPAEPDEDGAITTVAAAGTFGVVCSANTSSSGDVLTVFLVGPLEVTAQ